MLGLTLSEEFRGKRLKGMAVEPSNDTNTGTTQIAAKRSGRHAALIFIDLDNFKPLNDQLGHDVGDLLLMEVAGRLTGRVRDNDTVCRFGGDEFVVLLSDLAGDEGESTSDARIVSEKIRTRLAQPYVLGVRHAGQANTTVVHRCTASIGAVVFNKHHQDPESLLKWADAAMYQAKDAGRNRVSFMAKIPRHEPPR